MCYNAAKRNKHLNTKSKKAPIGRRDFLRYGENFMKYVYPAKIYAETGGGYTVAFPNVEGAIAQGEKLFDALTLAEQALCQLPHT